MNIWKCTEVFTAFFLMGHAFGKSIEDRVKLLESKVLNKGSFV